MLNRVTWLTVGRQGGKWRERKGKDITEGEVKTISEANSEGVNKNKNAHGGYSKYYSSSILIIVGMGILFGHREVAQTEKRRMTRNRQSLDTVKSNKSGH